MTECWYVLATWADDERVKCLYKGTREASAGFALAMVSYAEVDAVYLAVDTQDDAGSPEIRAFGPLDGEGLMVDICLQNPDNLLRSEFASTVHVWPKKVLQ